MYEDFEAAAAGLGPAFQQLSALGQRATGDGREALRVERSTGAVAVDRDALRRVGEHFAPRDVLDQTDRFERTATGLELGFAVSGEHVGLPWAMLVNPVLRSHVTAEQWSALGVEPFASTGDIAATLARRFPGVPDRLLDPETLRQVARAATVADVQVSAQQTASGMAGLKAAGGFDEDDDDSDLDLGNEPGNRAGRPSTTPVTVGPMLSGITPSEVLASIDCLAGASWTSDGWSVSICMDRACADALEAILLGTAGAAVLGAIGKAIAAASLAAGAAALGWVGAALVASAIYWGLMIRYNKTSNGVCIVHYLPWTSWFIPIPGYAQGV